MKTNEPTEQQRIIWELSQRIVEAQKPIRVLDALKWDAQVRGQFFANGCKELPKVSSDYYKKYPLPYDIEEKIGEFYAIERDINRLLGQFSGVGSVMLRTCREYRSVIRMLESRGNSKFTEISLELYGSSEDAFYPGAPELKDLAVLLSNTLKSLREKIETDADIKCYTSEEAVDILSHRLSEYFADSPNKVTVMLSDDIIADAAAGAEYIKLRRDAVFSERDIRLLEVHEGWVHVGTTLNGLQQPYCTFLGKGAPSSTITQEGLAAITEIFTFSSHPSRVQRLTNRVAAIYMAEQGANFLEVFNYFREHGFKDEESYSYAMRVFRGSTPEGGPFTKDLAYAKGFILIYNYIRLAVQQGLVDHIPVLFVGKTTLEDLQILRELVAEGIVVPPRYMPSQFKDLAALSSWMCFSLFMNKLNLEKLSENYKHILHD